MNPASPQGGSFQQQVLRRFTALWLLRQPSRQTWSGSLILTCGLGGDGAALALAANIAGAVCLSIEPNVELLKSAQRSGACDFAVNTLDEALRAMKNEIRKGRALSVGLHGDPVAVLAEVLERGLLPVAVADMRQPRTDEVRAAMQHLRSMGAQIVDFGAGNTEDAVDAMALVEDWARKQGSTLHCIGAAGQSDLASLDEALRKLTTPGDPLRLRWLERAPQHFLRERPPCRAIWLNDAEADALRAAGHEL